VDTSRSSDAGQPVHDPTDSPEAATGGEAIALRALGGAGEPSCTFPRATTLAVGAMNAAGQRIVDAMAHPERTDAPDFSSNAQLLRELLHRARWSCILLSQREFAGDRPALGWDRRLDPWHTLLGSSVAQIDGIDGVWRILTGQTPMGSQPLDWPFTLARWLLAPLLCDSPVASQTEWARMFRRGGLDRRSARRCAEMTIAAERESERLLGSVLSAELRRSQFMHPVRLAPFARLIADATRHERVWIAVEGLAVVDERGRRSRTRPTGTTRSSGPST
jgi:hypothetical protein